MLDVMFLHAGGFRCIQSIRHPMIINNIATIMNHCSHKLMELMPSVNNKKNKISPLGNPMANKAWEIWKFHYKIPCMILLQHTSIVRIRCFKVLLELLQFEITHDDVIKWKHFPRYWPFVRGIHRSRWIPRTKASDAALWCFLWSASE